MARAEQHVFSYNAAACACLSRCLVALSGRRWILAILLVYGAAKITEMYDHQIYELIGFSGHSLKHLIAAFGAFLFLKGLEVRKPVK